MFQRVIRRARPELLGLLLLQPLSACSPDASAGDRASAAAAMHAVPATPKAIDLGSGPYREIALTAVGSVSGIISRSDSSADNTRASRAPSDTLDPDCDPRRAAAPAAASGTVPNAVVWIANVAAGKALPEEKRTELESDNCLLDPPVQAIVVGTTVNVINDDKTLHRLVFTSDAGRDTLTQMPFFNEGEIVASERLAKTPGLVDVTCSLHQFTRGHLAVFAHPYFAVTDRAGRYKIDSLPPGTYTLRVWREGDVSPTNRQITISAAGNTTANVALK